MKNHKIKLLLGILALVAPVHAMAQSTAGDTVAVATAANPYSADTPLEEIVADPAAKAVLDKAFPDIAKHPNFERFKALSLRRLQPYAKEQISDEALAAVDIELKAVRPSVAKP